MLSSDIDESILAALQALFTNKLITALVGDPLAIKVLKQSDLQDDPTTTAPYLTYRPDIEKGIGPIPKELEAVYGCAEIGGPIKFLHYYDATFGVPLFTTRNDARAAVALVQQRIMRVLMDAYDLSNILVSGQELMSPDMSKRIEGANPYHMIDKGVTHIFGGETTFYAQGRLYWHYPVSWYS